MSFLLTYNSIFCYNYICITYIRKKRKLIKRKGKRIFNPKYVPGFWAKCLLAFSPTVNGRKIISTEPAARDSLTCLHGLRVFSLGWVVMVHTYLQVFAIAGEPIIFFSPHRRVIPYNSFHPFLLTKRTPLILENKTLRTVTERNFMFQTISNATFSVDTFFFIR